MTLDYRNPMHEPTRKRRASLIVWAAGILLVLLLLLSMLPSIGRPRESANIVRCASNLRQIGQAAPLYANDHGGEFPPDLPTILQTEDITAEVFICPSSKITEATGATTQAAVASLRAGGHTSYAWAGEGVTVKAPADVVLAFDIEAHLPSDDTTTGINVLCADGSVQFVSKATARAIWAQFKAGVRPIHLLTCVASAATRPVSSP